MTRCAVLGSPVAHSLSPALHRAAYERLGLDWSYEALRIEAAELGDFVAGLDDSWRGLSLTMPLKEAVVDLGEPDENVRAVGVGNTLVLHRHGRSVHNTDIGGLAAALRRAGLAEIPDAVILGNGATARSALVALARLGCREILLAARSEDKTQALVALGRSHGIGVEHLGWGGALPSAELLVSTVPAEVASEVAPKLSARAVFDVVYDPWPTPLAAAAARHGLTVVNGLDLLAHQAVEQIELMTGLEVEADFLLSAGRAELLRRAGA